MKKSLLVLLLAVLLPSLLLGWLALRSAQEQQIVLERRTAELRQREAEAMATAARSLISAERRAFAEAVQRLLAAEPAEALAARFHAALPQAWSQQALGFALGADGRVLSPTAAEAAKDARTKMIFADNEAFVSGRAQEQAFPVPLEELARPELAPQKWERQQVRDLTVEQKRAQTKAQHEEGAARHAPAAGLAKEEQREGKDAAKPMARSGRAKQQAAPTITAPAPAPASAAAPAEALRGAEIAMPPAAPAPPAEPLLSQGALRNVAPQQFADAAASQLSWATADFRQFSAQGSEGVVNRFVGTRLQMIFWVRPPQAPQLVFGCILQPEDLRERWPEILAAADTETNSRSDYLGRKEGSSFIYALLNDQAQPQAVFPVGAKAADWRQPFVATEIGEALPHWEAALYLARPDQFAVSARASRRTLLGLITLALAAIAIGGWVVWAEARQEMQLAQKKTDFVSNVSHELKTPLTSIRMFAEMMQSGRAAPERQGHYLSIIMVEAERLTRLINNVLDFARVEKQQAPVERRALDLRPALERWWDGQEMHLRAAGFDARWEREGESYPVMANEDAVIQVLVNLLSNAEKYGGEAKEITLHTRVEGGAVLLSVLDRGAGVPRGQERRIFEPFFRAHDSLSSGIPGTGLGLSLAQRLVAEQGGTLTYAPREGGGACFTIALPLQTNEETAV